MYSIKNGWYVCDLKRSSRKFTSIEEKVGKTFEFLYREVLIVTLTVFCVILRSFVIKMDEGNHLYTSRNLLKIFLIVFIHILFVINKLILDI